MTIPGQPTCKIVREETILPNEGLVLQLIMQAPITIELLVDTEIRTNQRNQSGHSGN